jgi:hypothetical protein
VYQYFCGFYSSLLRFLNLLLLLTVAFPEYVDKKIMCSVPLCALCRVPFCACGCFVLVWFCAYLCVSHFELLPFCGVPFRGVTFCMCIRQITVGKVRLLEDHCRKSRITGRSLLGKVSLLGDHYRKM